MTLIKDLQAEHGEIHELFFNIENEMEDLKSNKEIARSISRKLKEIKDRVINHFLIEEEKLYPILLDKERPDGIIDKESDDNQTLVKEFMDQQREIGEKFVLYIDKYSNSENITANYQIFYSETEQIFRKVQSLIESEEKKLFPLFLDNHLIF